jgi:hypothetical protein
MPIRKKRDVSLKYLSSNLFISKGLPGALYFSYPDENEDVKSEKSNIGCDPTPS